MQQIKKRKPKLTGSLLNIYIHSVLTVRRAGQTWLQWFYFFFYIRAYDSFQTLSEYPTAITLSICPVKYEYLPVFTFSNTQTANAQVS